ncbi:MAG: GAF domain-containing protein [Chloroflexi bacterium]|nr:GAF domain-containing protein [Chloroflexota bacterium]
MNTIKRASIASSLRLKVALGILMPMLVTLAILSFFEYHNQRRLMLENLRLSAANAGQIIEGSLWYAMQTNDLSRVQQIISDVAKQPELQALWLLDKTGRTIMAADPDMIGTTFDPSDVTCLACHQGQVASGNESILLTDERVGPIFRNVNAIENTRECQVCHDPQDQVLGVLISDFSTAQIDSHLIAFGRNRLIWAGGSLLAALLIAVVMTERVLIGRVTQLVQVVRGISRGKLARVERRSADELGVLADAINQVADTWEEKHRLECSLAEQAQMLRAQAEDLATLNAMAVTVSQSLNLDEIMDGALDKVLELIGAAAGWILLWDEGVSKPVLAASRGVPAQMVLDRALCQKNPPACCRLNKLGKAIVLPGLPDGSCMPIQAMRERGLDIHACVPLQAKGRVLGVMGLAARAPLIHSERAKSRAEMLTAIGRQMGIAIENARLYEQLRKEQELQRQLLDRALTAQEEERKHIARELHDQTGQALSSLLMTLDVLAQSDTSPAAAKHLAALRDLATQILEQVHDLALELRPSVLDDLGLLPAIRHYLRGYQDRFHIPVEFQAVGFDHQRLPAEVETALYRIMQEALANVVKHARARNVSVLLENRGRSVVLMVEDDGQGFEVDEIMGHDLDKGNLGLYGMRERATLLHGTLTIESSPGQGTAVYVQLPLEYREGS